MQRPPQPGARRLGEAERDEAVVPAPQQRGRDRDALQAGHRLGAERDQPAHRPLDVRDARPRHRVRAERGEPRRILAAHAVEVEERQAVEPLRVALGRAQREPDRRHAQAERHPVPPDAGRAVDDEPLEQLAVLGREAGGEAASERVCDQRRRLVAGHPQQRAEPGRERRGVEPVDRLRLAEPGQVGHDHAVALGEPGDDGRPDRPAALDPAVQEDQRRAVAGLDHRGRGPGEVEPPLGDRQPGQHPPHDRRFPSTTGIVCPSTSVGLNSTSSAPA